MRRAALILLLAGLVAGCAGYKIGPIKPRFMGSIQTIAIPTFRNDTLEPRVEVDLANAIINQFQQDGTYKIVDEKDADAILESSLEQIQRHPARSVIGNVLQTQEFTLTLRARFILKRRDTGVIIDRRAVTGQTSFFVSGSGSVAADVNQNERQAIPLAAQDMAVQLVSQYSEGW